MTLLMDSLKSMILLWINLAEQFDINVKDRQVFERRAKSEGRQFLFIDLSTLGRDINRSLITGQALIITARFALKRHSALPVFLYDLFRSVFDDTGLILEHADPTNMRRIRQLTLLYYKTKVQHGADRDYNTLDREFIERDLACGVSPIAEEAVRAARRRIGRILRGLSPYEIVPRHGSGATSCRTPNHDKYHQFRYIPRLAEVYPYDEYFFYSTGHLCDNMHKLYNAETVIEPCSKLCAVPKDMRGPRLICCEPKEMQFIQQGLMRVLYKRIESHPDTTGFVNFTDQSINQNLARESSITGELATLDLKDASDLVSWQLVQSIFPTEWVNAMDSCRTRYVEMLGKTIYGPLRKFAPMGSALCFPVEALTFWALLSSHLNCRVWVYGDDIILDASLVKEASALLESFGLRVNAEKSCYKTPFRESCGGDYFAGFDVSYVKLREQPDNTIESEVSLVDFCNNIAKAYGDTTARGIRDMVDGLYGPHFYQSSSCPLSYIGDHRASNDVFFKRRWNKDLQYWEYLVRTVESPKNAKRKHSLHSWGEIFRWHCENNHELSTLGEYAVAGCTQKYRWRSIY